MLPLNAGQNNRLLQTLGQHALDPVWLLDSCNKSITVPVGFFFFFYRQVILMDAFREADGNTGRYKNLYWFEPLGSIIPYV